MLCEVSLKIEEMIYESSVENGLIWSFYLSCDGFKFTLRYLSRMM